VTSRTQAAAAPARPDEAVRRKRMSAPDRREAILGAALEVFAEKGFEGATLGAVAERAGVSKALIYEHFDSKSELTRALLDTFVHDLLGQVAEAVAGAEPGGPRMRAGVDAFLSFVEDRPEAWRLTFRNLADPGISDLIAALQEESAGAIAALMAADETVQAGAARRPDMDRAVDAAAHQLVGGLQALANWWLDHPDVPRERVLELAMDFGWLGLERIAAGERWATPEG
jgi:AcrR family transcriptional regulator